MSEQVFELTEAKDEDEVVVVDDDDEENENDEVDNDETYESMFSKIEEFAVGKIIFLLIKDVVAFEVEVEFKFSIKEGLTSLM